MVDSPRDASSIALIRGDGIGPELIAATVQVLDAVAARHGFGLDYFDIDAGADTYRRTGTACSPQSLERMRTQADAILKGPVGLPDVRHPDGTEAGVLGGILRTGLDTYANIRSITLLPAVESSLRDPGPIDYVIVRENTEGLYASRGNGVGNRWAVSDTMIITREGTLRVVRRAFELARGRGGAPSDGVRRVTCVDKSNVLRSFALFRDIFTEVSVEYPDIEVEYLYSDAAAQALVLRPSTFDVLVMENFVGDMLSDLGGATVGGIAMCPSGNLGDHAAYFEPVHGSAPELAGRGSANPIGQILCAGMMLTYLGRPQAGAALQAAVRAALVKGTVRLRADGSAVDGAEGLARAVIDEVDAAPVPC
ncbi:MAG: isocitrate/isopropylmalate dehydrogenase [Pseudonocardiales bacterium]|nr:isocitrate/isopropylmalate dehydrogenase [Pseudonocardiales bacterium]